MDEIGTFSPDSNIKRSEVSAILTRMMNKDARKVVTLDTVTPTFFIVGFNSNGGSPIESRKVNENEKMERPSDPTKEGFQFAGWYCDSNLTEEYDFNKPVTENLNLYAKWKENKEAADTNTEVTFMVGFNSNGGSIVDPQIVKENGKAFWPSDPVKEGYHFRGWYRDSNLTKEYNFNNPVTKNLYLYAKWI